MRSPFLPAILAQSSGFVVFGRSSFSLNSSRTAVLRSSVEMPLGPPPIRRLRASFLARRTMDSIRSEEHTSELQSLAYLVCRLLLEKKKHENLPHPSLALGSRHLLLDTTAIRD